MSLKNEVAEEKCRSGHGAALTVLTLAGLTVAALIVARRAKLNPDKPAENILTLCDRAVRALDERVAAAVAG